MKRQQQIEALTNFLRNISKNEKLFIYPDEIKGKTFCIAEEMPGGTKCSKSNFMTYEEMNCFFFGVLAQRENRINF
jgi:hypothetical protein